MTTNGLIAGVFATLLAAFQAAPADLSSARTLYASASFEEALAVLDRLPDSDKVEPVSELRALCLLALGRTDDAEEAITTLVMHNPAYQLPQTEVSPKLVALFQEVRRQTLPAAARAAYEKAKARYDDKAWADAAAQFSALLKLLDDPDAAGNDPTSTDLKQLTEGFLALSRGEISAAERRAADARAAEDARKAEDAAAAAQASREAQPVETAAAAPAVNPPVPPAAPARSADVYSADDVDVTPPVELKRVMPRWLPPTPAMAQVAHRGILELIIDEAGGVASARVTKPIAPSYDMALRDLARSWKYRPAMRGNQAVRYRHVLEIVLRPAP